MNNDRDGSSLERAAIISEEEQRREIQSRLMLPRNHEGQSVLTPTKSRHYLDASGNQVTVNFKLTLDDDQWEVVEEAFTLDNGLCLLRERSGRDVIRVLDDALLVIDDWTGIDREYRTRVVLEIDPDFHRYPSWALQSIWSRELGRTVMNLSIDGLLIAFRLFLLCYIPSEGGFNADGVEEYQSLVDSTSQEAALALYWLRQFIFNITRRYHVETLDRDTYVHGQVANIVDDASYYRLPLRNMIQGIFNQPDSHYDNGQFITRKGPTVKGVNPNAVPGQRMLSLDTWNTDHFPLHIATGLGSDWKKRGAIEALCRAGFREAPFTREIFRCRIYTSIDRDYWEDRRRDDAIQAVANNRPPIWTP